MPFAQMNWFYVENTRNLDHLQEKSYKTQFRKEQLLFKYYYFIIIHVNIYQYLLLLGMNNLCKIPIMKHTKMNITKQIKFKLK